MTGSGPRPFGPHDNYPYLTEVRDTAEDALICFTELEKAAHRWLEVNERAGYPSSDPREMTQRMSQEQSAIFRSLEAFLAAFTRVSLLLYPSGGRKDDPYLPYRKARGACLRYLLECTANDPIKNVELRNAWAHFDERMDLAGIESTLFGRQGWGHSSTTTNQHRDGYLRYVEVDTLRITYRDHANRPRTTELVPLRDALARVFDRLSGDHWKEVAVLLNAMSGNPCR